MRVPWGLLTDFWETPKPWTLASQAGAFGYTFEFGLTWDMEGEGRGPGKGLDFKLREEAGTIKSLLGGYRSVRKL